MKLKLFMLAHLFIIVCGTVVFAQESQETFNARTRDRIVVIESKVDDNSRQLASFISEMSTLRSSLDRFSGIGLGIGATLTALQIVQVVLMRKRA